MNTPIHIDHIVLAAPDLDCACDDFESATSIRPAFGGAHPGGGTHNALVAFEDTDRAAAAAASGVGVDSSSYLEIIAPDPAQPPTPMSTALKSLTRPTLLHWAVRCRGLADVATRLRRLGWTPTEIRHMSRTPPNGVRLEWELFGLRDHRHGGLAPFFIDWLKAPHPCATSPRVGVLSKLRISTPEPAQLRELIAELGVDVTVDGAPQSIELLFASPRGQVTYTGRSPAGFMLGR